VSAVQAKSTVLTTALNADASLLSAYHRNISKHVYYVPEKYMKYFWSPCGAYGNVQESI
jgi:hypothetical protein